MIAIFVSILLALVLGAGCAPRVGGTTDVPVGDDLTTTAVEGTVVSPYGNIVALSIFKGEGKYPANLSLTMTVRDVLDTRTIRGEITPPIPFLEAQEGNMIYLYLCTPLSEKADKLSNGTIGYKGDGYPQIVVGGKYDVTGVLQPGWQDYPFVYVTTASQFKQASADSIDTQIFIDAARSFAEQVTGGKYHMTAEPVITVDSKYVQAGKMEIMMLVKTMTALNSGTIDDEPMIAGELQYLQDHSTTLSSVAKKAVEDDIAYWRGTIKSAMNGSSETNYIIKIVGDVDATGNIDVGSLQVYVDEGAPKGNAWVLAAQYFKNMRSAFATVAQGDANAASLASAADAKAP
jgi:hypothetical protein